MDERSLRMRELYRDGETLAEIGVRFDLTRERVRQILNKEFGFTRSDGGAKRRRQLSEAKKARARESYYLKKYGMTRDRYIAVNECLDASGRRPIFRFGQQKRNADTRGIEFDITFAEWWDIWERSGRWLERGRGGGYCMARFGDSGAYSLSNVKIIPAKQNNSEYINRYWAKVRGGKIKRVKSESCKRGHPFDSENTYLLRGAVRVCRACQALRTRKYRAKKRKRLFKGVER